MNNRLFNLFHNEYKNLKPPPNFYTSSKQISGYAPGEIKQKKAQLSLTNPRNAWNSGHGSLKGIESDTIR